MIFYFNVKGESVGITPERIFQGGKNSNAITFVGAVNDVDVVSARFEYNAGLKIENAVLVRDENFSAINLRDELGNGYTAWTCDIPANVLAKSGIVTVQFFITTPTGTVISTSAVTFDVESGVEESEPVKTDTYAQVLETLSSLKTKVDSLESSGGAGGGGTKLYKYTINGTFMDHSSGQSFLMQNLSFVCMSGGELTGSNCFAKIRSSLGFTGGNADIPDSSGNYYGRYVPFAVGSGSGIRGIAMLNQETLAIEYRIFEQITITDYTIEEI